MKSLQSNFLKSIAFYSERIDSLTQFFFKKAFIYIFKLVIYGTLDGLWHDLSEWVVKQMARGAATPVSSHHHHPSGSPAGHYRRAARARPRSTATALWAGAVCVTAHLAPVCSQRSWVLRESLAQLTSIKILYLSHHKRGNMIIYSGKYLRQFPCWVEREN